MTRAGLLTERYDVAFTYALHAHDKQTRKGTKIPYAAHLMSVAALVLEAGGTQDEAIIALLHDAVEDAGGAERLGDIHTRFGVVIADGVQECSEEKTPGLDWKTRKQRYLDRLGGASTSALRVSLADKLHNARSILADYRTLGDNVWSRFNASKPADQIWFYEQLIAAYSQRAAEIHAPLLAELRRTIGGLRLLLARPGCELCGAGDVVPVLFGMPPEAELLAVEAGQVVLAGCVVPPEPPDWACQVCGHQWQDREHPGSG